jgi:hypothetical protein
MNNVDVMGAGAAIQQQATDDARKGKLDPVTEKAQKDQAAAAKADAKRKAFDIKAKQVAENERQKEIKSLRKDFGIEEGIGGKTLDRAIEGARERVKTMEQRSPGITEAMKEDRMRKLDRLEELTGRDKDRGGGGQGGQVKITGTLVMKADGTAQLDAEGGVPVNE